MVQPSQEPTRRPPEHDTRGIPDATRTQPGSVPVTHTVAHPSQIPRVGWGPLAAWIGAGLLFTVMIVLYFVLPMLKSNTEEENHPRRPEIQQPNQR